jgi:endonuclease YncB( thermonuclease family)
MTTGRNTFGIPAAPALFFVVAIAACGVSDAVSRSLPGNNPAPVASARVRAVVDGDTIVLDTGAEVRLTGIQAPKLPLGRKGFRAWLLAQKAKAEMKALSLRRDVRLEYTGQRFDRWGRLRPMFTTAIPGSNGKCCCAGWRGYIRSATTAFMPEIFTGRNAPQDAHGGEFGR